MDLVVYKRKGRQTNIQRCSERSRPTNRQTDRQRIDRRFDFPQNRTWKQIVVSVAACLYLGKISTYYYNRQTGIRTKTTKYELVDWETAIPRHAPCKMLCKGIHFFVQSLTHPFQHTKLLHSLHTCIHTQI